MTNDRPAARRSGPPRPTPPSPPILGHVVAAVTGALVVGAVVSGCQEERAGEEPPAPESSPSAPRPPSPIFGTSEDEDPSRVDAGALTPGFVRIPAGSFAMGSAGLELKRFPDEVQHPVRISRAFEMQMTEVTQAEYGALMGRNPSEHTDCGASCPVEQVSWHEAAAYCNRLSERRGLPRCYVIKESGVDLSGLGCRGFRLPTEAEWEYAARAGSGEARYGPVDQIAWYDKSSGMRPHEVAGLRPNAWGLYDMLGNVFEWTWDWMGDYPTAATTDPTGPAHGKNKVFRGGAFRWTDAEARHAFRNAYGPRNKVGFIGFRCVRTLPLPGS